MSKRAKLATKLSVYAGVFVVIMVLLRHVTFIEFIVFLFFAIPILLVLKFLNWILPG